MKERSKNAARTRREKENHEFSELARLLPHPSSSTANMDKATVVKLTTAYLKLRNVFPYGLGAPWGSETQDTFLRDHAAFLVKSLEGFLMVIGRNLKVIYVSEGVSFYLGLSQTEMMGNGINEYVHPCDHDELKGLLNHEQTIPVEDQIPQEIEIARSFSLRMKCVLTKRSAGLVIDKFKVIHFRGYLKMAPISLPVQGTASTSEVRYQAVGFVAVGNAIHPTTSLEVKMYSNTFMYRAELDFKFIHVESRVKELTGYDPQHLLRRRLYQFVHASDSLRLAEDHRKLLVKGQAVSGYYRFLTLKGGWVWMQSSFVLLLNSKSRQPFVLAINHALSECEHKEWKLEEEQEAKSVALKWDENVRPVSKKTAVPEILRKEVPKVKKKSSSVNLDIANNYFDQFTATDSYVQAPNTTMSFTNIFQPVACNPSPTIAVASSRDLQPTVCIQPVNTAATFANDVKRVASTSPSSHASTSYGLRHCWYSGENAKSSHKSTDDLHHSNTHSPVNDVHNSTGFYHLFPASTNSAYFGSISDPSYSSSVYPNPATNHQMPHAAGATTHSETPYAFAQELSYSRVYNNSYSGELQPYDTEPCVKRFCDFVDALPPDFYKDNKPTTIHNNGNSYSDEQLPFYVEHIGQQPLNNSQKYKEANNSHLPSAVDNSENEAYNNSNEISPILSGSDCFPENSKNSLENISDFDLSGINAETGIIFSNNAKSAQLCSSSVNPCPSISEHAKDQMCFDSSSYRQEISSMETTEQQLEPLNVSFEIAPNWPSLINLTTAEPFDNRYENVLNTANCMPQTHASELSPVSANSSLSSDPNNEQINSYLNSSSDYSNGYCDEANAGVVHNAGTDYEKDLFGLSSFQSRASSTPLYTAL